MDILWIAAAFVGSFVFALVGTNSPDHPKKIGAMTPRSILFPFIALGFFAYFVASAAGMHWKPSRDGQEETGRDYVSDAQRWRIMDSTVSTAFVPIVGGIILCALVTRINNARIEKLTH